MGVPCDDPPQRDPACGAPPDVWWAIGVHSDFRGSWLVNGSMEGIVFLDLDPPARGRSGPIPIRIKRLGLGLEDPEDFLRQLGIA